MSTEDVISSELDSKSLTHIKLPVFEGPLDLLLYLIKKDELDIYDIPIEHITTQYLEYLRLIKMLDLEVAGEYLVVAATLLYIKSRVLLPHDQRPPEDEAEEDDPRWELIRQLVEYKKYKDAAFELQQCLIRQENSHPRGGTFKPDMTADGSLPFDKVGLFDLLAVFQKILSRASKEEDLRDIFEERYTVSDKIQFILGEMVTRSRITFETLFTAGTTRTEIVVTFLAVLELIRLKQIGVAQEGPFASIDIVKLAPAHSDFVTEETEVATSGEEVPTPPVEEKIEATEATEPVATEETPTSPVEDKVESIEAAQPEAANEILTSPVEDKVESVEAAQLVIADEILTSPVEDKVETVEAVEPVTADEVPTPPVEDKIESIEVTELATEEESQTPQVEDTIKPVEAAKPATSGEVSLSSTEIKVETEENSVVPVKTEEETAPDAPTPEEDSKGETNSNNGHP